MEWMIFIKMLVSTSWFKTSIILMAVDTILWYILPRINFYKHTLLHGLVFYIAITLPMWIFYCLWKAVEEVMNKL